MVDLERMKQTIIPAIRRMKDFEFVLELPVTYIVLLDSSLTNLHHIVTHVHRHGKKVLVHADLIEGLKSDESGIDYLTRHVKPDGVLSTRRNVIAAAKKNDLIAILRLFIIDSIAMETGVQNVLHTQPDYIELLPGITPSVIRDMSKSTNIPVITGGLIKTEEEVAQALAAGAVSVTTSKRSLWEKFN